MNKFVDMYARTFPNGDQQQKEGVNKTTAIVNEKVSCSRVPYSTFGDEEGRKEGRKKGNSDEPRILLDYQLILAL